MDKNLMNLFWECIQAPYIPPPKIPDKCNLLGRLEQLKLKNYNKRIVEILSDENTIDVLADIAKLDYQKLTITKSIDFLIEQRRASGIYSELYEKVI